MHNTTAHVLNAARLTLTAVLVCTLLGVLSPQAMAQPSEETTTTTTTPAETTTTTLVEETTTTTIGRSTTTTTTTPAETTTTTLVETPVLPAAPEQPLAFLTPGFTPTTWSIAPQFNVPTLDDAASVTALLVSVRGELAAAQQAQVAATAQHAAAETDLVVAEAELAALTRRRTARAVSSYIAAEAIIAVSLAGDEASTRVSTAIGHVEALDADGQVALSERITRNETALRDANTAATAAAEQELALTEAIAALEAKLNSTVDVTTPVGVGRSTVAAAANSADIAVDELRASQLRMDGTHVAAATTVRAALNALAVQVAPLEGVTTTPLGVWPGSVAEQSTDPLALTAAETPTTRALADTWSRMDLRRLRVMLFALQQVGKSYVWAAAGPEAYDCSGLMLRAYAREGVTLVHFSGTQSHSGPPVAWPDIQPTDLMGYGPNGAGHVTMHIGGGRMVEAKGAAYGVVVSNARPGDANARIG